MTLRIMGNQVFKHKLLLMLTVTAAMVLALVLSFAPGRNASAADFVLLDTITGGDDPFFFVQGVAVDADDNIRVVDSLAGTLRSFDKDGLQLSSTTLESPQAIAIDGSGNSVVAENLAESGGQFRIATCNADGSSCSSFTVDRSSPGVAINAAGDYIVIQSDGGGGRLAVYSPATADGGAPIRIFGDQGSLTDLAQGVTLDSDGKIYATDNGDGRVVVFNADETSPSEFASGMAPYGLAVDTAGRVYVADQGGPNGVQVFESDGTPLTTIDVGGIPFDVAIDSQGRVIVPVLAGIFPELVSVVNIFSGLPVVGGGGGDDGDDDDDSGSSDDD